MFPQFPGAPPPAERATGGKAARGAPPEPDNLEFIFPRRGRCKNDASREAIVDTIAPLREIVHDPPGGALAGVKARSEPEPRVETSPHIELASPVEAPHIELASPLELASPADEAPDGEEADIAGHEREERAAEATVTTAPAAGAGPDMLDDTSPPWRGRVGRVDADDDWNLDDEPSADVAATPRDPEPSFELGRNDDAVTVGDIDAPPPHTPRVFDMEAMMSASARIPALRPATRLLLTFVAVFALLALLLRANPERTETLLGRLPLVGGSLTAEPALSGRITLTGVQGGYQRLRNGRRIFVIAGKATNNSLVPVERIEVEGALYAGSGAVDRKVISTGNRTTLKLRDLTESEIALLQNLDGRQTVAPGGSIDFSIVFLEPPRDLREFSSRVLTARSTGRAPAPPDGVPSNPASVG